MPQPTRQAADRAAARISEIVEGVFALLDDVRDRTAALAGTRRRPAKADLAALRPALFAHLGGLVAGIGFIAAPGLLVDAPWYLEWWQDDPSGRPVQLLRDLDPAGSAFYDYTHWEWYAGPCEGAERTICGPYVDYLCTDEYSLTLSVPVTAGGVFAGVAAADVFVRRFEGAVVPVLREVPAPAFVISAAGRVVASSTAKWIGGSVFRGEDGFEAHPCGELPLSLVVASTATLRGNHRTPSHSA
ncbi:cache domain-containing protein [Nonomuraea sp. NPDC050404]|uniref:cache domain-containing protein n=1 Tax=Nonomuraea sp. NPDC050404 TaxID=3155783 RepID=UPI0033EF1C8A